MTVIMPIQAGRPGISFRIGMAARAAMIGTDERKTDVARGPIWRMAILRQDMPSTLGTKPWYAPCSRISDLGSGGKVAVQPE